MWEQQVADLQADFRCLVLDLPGHGGSGHLPWKSLSATAHEVAALIRSRTARGKAHVVGLSIGAYVAMKLMSVAPEGVDHAVLSGLNVLPLPNLWVMNLMGLALLPFVKTERMIRMNARGLHVPEASYEGYRASVRGMSRRAYWRASGDASTFRLPANAATISNPTLLVAGEGEHALIRQALATVAGALPHAEARIVPGVGHGWNGEKTALFTQTVRAWITDVPLPPELQALPEG